MEENLEIKNEKEPNYWDLLNSYENLSALYPEISSSQFDNLDADDIFKKKPTLIDRYNDLPVKPYIRRKNLNEGDDSAPNKGAWEIGIRIDF